MRWFEYLDPAVFGNSPSLDGHLASGGMLRRALDHMDSGYECTVYSGSSSGRSEAGRGKLEELLIKKAQVKLIWREYSHCERRMFANEDTFVYMSIDTDDDTTKLYITSTVEQVVKEVLEYTSKDFKEIPEIGHVYVIVSTPTGMDLKSLGVASVPFEKTNYSPEVVRDFEYTLGQFRSTDPDGRILLLSGEKGTGKTHLMQALVGLVSPARFILVPTHAIPSLAEPGVISMLMDLQDDDDDSQPVPTIFLLEDADRALVKREDSNVDVLSALLNFGDGILAKTLDIRIAATTNLRERELDEAVTREGRLCRHIEVGTLSQERALEAYTRITGKTEVPEALKAVPNGISLARVYKAAKDSGWKPPQINQKMGFHRPKAIFETIDAIGITVEDIEGGM